MKVHNPIHFRFVLPLAGFVLHPLTSVVIAALLVLPCRGHLPHLIAADVQWTHFWKGFGRLAGAYVFAALASRGLAKKVNAFAWAVMDDAKAGGLDRRQHDT